MRDPAYEREVSDREFQRLTQWGESSRGSSAEVLDVHGQPLVLHGQPAPTAEALLFPLTHRNGVITVDCFDGNQPPRQVSIWVSHLGLLHAAPSPTGTMVLTCEPYESLYRMLIDSAGLHDLPALPSTEPMEVPGRDLMPRTWSVASSRRKACAKIGQSLPDELAAVATLLMAGEASLVKVTAVWESSSGPQRGKLAWISTPAGVLTHEVQQRGLRQRHELEAEHPGWMWLRLLDRLPRAEDLQYWEPNDAPPGPPSGLHQS